VLHSRGGSGPGYRRWAAFLARGGLRSYAKRRNNALGTTAVLASFVATVVTEIYLCNVCACHEILRRSGRRQIHRGCRACPGTASVT
jgi:hypothetical protein